MATFGELETLWRRRAFDDIGAGGSETNWTAIDIYRAIAEGEEQWCRRTKALFDYTSAFLSLSGADNASEFPLDSRILEIRRVKLASATILLPVSLDELDLYSPTWESDPAGTPKFYATDRQTTKMWVYPKLATSDTLLLTVARLPLTSTDTPLPTWTGDSLLEILPTYHLDLLDWVTYRMYDFQSRQTERPQSLWFEKSREAYQRFEDKYGALAPAGQEAVRQKDLATPDATPATVG